MSSAGATTACCAGCAGWTERFSAVSNQIDAIARSHLPHDPWEAQRFIEILQRAAQWTQGAKLAEAIRDTIPDDQEHAIQRRGARHSWRSPTQRDHLRRGATPEASAALCRARAAVDEQQAQIDRLPKPWAGQVTLSSYLEARTRALSALAASSSQPEQRCCACRCRCP